jgi:soluble lytic murein transglycosylase-like protein
VIWQESRFRPDTVGPPRRDGRRAQGIAQFMPSTAAEREAYSILSTPCRHCRRRRNSCASSKTSSAI